MKIVAYSKVPATTPFVHLGYLAASTATTKPVQGLLVGGVIVLTAGLLVMGRWLSRQRKLSEPAEASIARTSISKGIGLALLLLSGVLIWSAYTFGEKNRVFHYPEEATRDHIGNFTHTAVNRFKPGNTSLPKPPTQEGQYDLYKAFGLPADFRRYCVDGWNTPLILRVIQREDELEYVVVSAGPDRTLDTQDDITSLEFVETRQIIHLQEDGSKQSPPFDSI